MAIGCTTSSCAPRTRSMTRSSTGSVQRCSTRADHRRLAGPDQDSDVPRAASRTTPSRPNQPAFRLRGRLRQGAQNKARESPPARRRAARETVRLSPDRPEMSGPINGLRHIPTKAIPSHNALATRRLTLSHMCRSGTHPPPPPAVSCVMAVGPEYSARKEFSRAVRPGGGSPV